MAEKEPIKWITVNGRRVPIYANKATDLSHMKYDETKDWFRENSNYSEWEEKIDDVDFTRDQSEWWKFDVPEAIHNYTGERYSWLNEHLRGVESKVPEWYDEDTMDEDVRMLDYAIAEFDLKKPITVYRSSDSELLGKPKMSYEEIKALEGKTVNDKAYLSTSTLKELPGEQTVGGQINYVVDIKAGKGVGAYIPKFSENNSEREFLVKRNSSYKISKVVKDKDGVTTVYMKMV